MNCGYNKGLEKTKALNLMVSKGFETLEEIIKFQHSPLIKIGLGYNPNQSGETS